MQCSQAVVFSSLSGNKVHYKGQRSPRGGAGLPVCTWPTAAVTQTKPRGRRLSCLHVFTLSLCTHTYSGQCDRLITAPSPRPLHSDTCGVIHTCLLWVVWERGTSVVFIWVLGSLSHSIVRQTLGLTTLQHEGHSVFTVTRSVEIVWRFSVNWTVVRQWGVHHSPCTDCP